MADGFGPMTIFACLIAIIVVITCAALVWEYMEGHLK